MFDNSAKIKLEFTFWINMALETINIFQDKNLKSFYLLYYEQNHTKYLFYIT